MCVLADHVLRHGRMLLEPGRTEGAAVWLLSRVRSKVVCEVPPCEEPGRAQVALVVLHSIVGLHMLGVIRYLVKRGAALPTPADDFPCVDTSVSRQVAPICERLPADVTHEPLLSTMFQTAV